MAYTENLITIQQQVSNHLLLFHLLSCKYQYKELYLQEEAQKEFVDIRKRGAALKRAL